MPDFSKYDLDKPYDISIPLSASANNVSAWYVSPPEIKAVENNGWIGDVNRGGSVNFKNIFFNPHGHGTHTECVGHISKEYYSVNQLLKTFFFKAILVTVTPREVNGDHIIYADQLNHLKLEEFEAIVIRTLPNEIDKLHRQYSHTNPPFLHESAAQIICQKGIKHLLVDLPSVDKEVDEGKLLAHRAFWQYPGNTRTECTITEFIFVPENIMDGEYLLNLQIAPFENDASPSKPVLYPLR